MKYTSKQTGNSRNNALLRRAARLGCGISMVAVSAMLAARPATAGPDVNAAGVISSEVPSESSSGGFVTSGSAQTNTGDAITAYVNDTVGTSTVDNSNSEFSPSTASVTGNKLAAYATGSAQTNTVDFETIGTGTISTGISVLADQANIFGEDVDTYIPETINAAVTNSSLSNETTNAVSGDSLTDSNNLITAQVEGNVAASSVNGVVPINYDTPKGGSITTEPTSASAQGNVVVASSQTNTAIDGGIGSFATLGSDSIILSVDSSGGNAQSLGLTATDSGNTASSVYLGNSANNDIGVALTAGTVTGAPSLAGSLVISNQQANTDALYGGGTFGGVGAITNSVSIGGVIGGEPAITLTDGSVTVDNNVISSSATNNSAVGAAGAPGNEITLGINLAGVTTSGINTINSESDLATGADLALSNQQYETAQGGQGLQSATTNFGVYATIQNLAGSTAGVSNNVASSSALGNVASNAIDTASGAGIDLISGLAALTSQQNGEEASSALTQYGYISIYAGNGDSALSVTNSALNLSGDQITSTAGVNQVTNAVSLSSSTIKAGALGAAVGPASVTLASDGISQTAAGISLNNDQIAYDGGEADAYESAVNIAAYLSGNTLSNDSVVVSNPVFSAVATANRAGNSINADGSQGISGSIGLLNTQSQGGAGADAALNTSDGNGNIAGISEESFGAAGITGSSALLSGTSFAAEATDNYASNTLDATGGTLSNVVSGTLGLAAQLAEDAVTGSAQAYTDLALANVQTDFNVEADASNADTVALIDANASGGSVSGSSFTVSGPANDAPASQALAIGDEAMNMLTAAASTVMQDTAGLLNAQANSTGASAALDSSAVYASVDGVPSSSPNEDGNDGGDVSNTSVVVGTGAAGGSNANILRALAYGNQATNELSATAGLLEPAATGVGDYAVDGSVIDATVPFNTSLSSEPVYGVGAAYALLNDQELSGLVSASALSDTVGAYIGNDTTNPTVTDVTESTAGNAEVSSAFGNQADNSGAISANDLNVGSYTPLADVTNIQTGLAEVEAYLSQDTGYNSFISQVAGTGEVTDSTIGVTDNSSITQVEANQAANSLDTTGGDITDTSAVPLPELSGYTFDAGPQTASAAFTVQNMQYNGPAVSVRQPESNALAAIGGAVDVSTVTADGNAFQATGYANNATNSLAFGGTDSPVDVLDTSSGLQNVQYADGDNVTLGSPGTLASAGTPDTVIPAVDYGVAAGTNTGVLSGNGETLQVEGNPLVFDLSSLTPTQRTDFENLFFFSEGSATLNGTNFTLTAGTYTLGTTDIFGTEDGNAYHTSGGALSGQPTYEEITLDDGTPATPAVPPSPSVLITVGGNITTSTLDVSNNAFDATAVANNAVNTQNIAATTVNGGADIPAGTAGGSVDGYEGAALADYALNNLQSDGYSVSATGSGEAGINPTNDSAITDSTLTASNNTQLTKAETNVASNTLSLSATSTAGSPPTLALTSYQYGDSSVTSTSGTLGETFDPGFVVTAPGAISDSTLTMDNNSSESLAVLNNVTNLVSADATTLDTANGETEDAQVSYGPDNTQADYSLTNVQLAQSSTISATDVTQIVNSDYDSLATTGLVTSAVDLSGNSTSSYAEANTANNTLDMTATNSTATGALLNQQTSEDTVSATGATDVDFNLTGSDDPSHAAATGSAINVNNDSLQVQAIGNESTNALNADTGATYGGQTGALANSSGASATYAVLNEQSNNGNVSATGVAYAYSNLDGGGSESPVSNTTVTVSYNVVDAKAFGNSADNSMTVAALNAGNATAALQNTQTNTGAITATVNGSQFGSYIGSPGASNATVAVGSNSVVASAIGNVATNSIAH